MKTASYIISLLALLICTFPHLSAQTTHAHSTSLQWKGIDVAAYQDSAAYYPNGKPIYLYNVGTGRFVVEGGSWGVEGRLFYEDFGRQMQLFTDGKINSGISETNIESDKHMFICNKPITTQDTSWRAANDRIFTTIMDGAKRWPAWTFVPIATHGETEAEGYHTYYMYQRHNSYYYKESTKQYKNFYLGAAYGEWCPDGTTTYRDVTTNDKGNGFYVNVDGDRLCWTTAGQTPSQWGAGSEIPPYENETKVFVNGDSVMIKELYQWRIISEEEFEHVLEEEVEGINPSVSSLIPDRDFTRNADDFYDWWTVSPATTTAAEGEGRRGYTWGYIRSLTLHTKGSPSGNQYYPEAWDQPVRIKMQYDDIKNAKFGYMGFEGVGTVSTIFKIPRTGWYQIEANAISFSADATHIAYMYAQPGNTVITDEQKASDMRAYYGYNEVPLVQKTDSTDLDIYPDITFPTTNRYKGQKEMSIAIGKVLTYHGTDYRHKLWVYVSPERFATDSTVTIGFRKDYATKSSKTTSGDINYYYDRDYVIVDDIKMSYMGLSPAFLYEDENSLDYLVFDINHVTERPSAPPTYQYAGSLSLARTLKKDQWNSFSLPIPLTGEQVRYAFGEDAHLVELVSIGGLSLNQNVIDFRTVELKPTDPLEHAVEPGKLYMLKPTKEPTTGEDPLGVLREYYELGRNYFSVNPEGEASTYEHHVMDATQIGAHYAVGSY